MTIINCVKCGKEIEKTRWNSKYCQECKHEVSLEYHRRNYKNHREDRLAYQEEYNRKHRPDRRSPGVCVGYKYIKRELRRILYEGEFYETESYHDPDEVYMTNYLGSFLSLDPCGRYHHVLSPNNVTRTCEKFWENLNTAAEDLGGWIESGEGDPLDIFYCFSKEVYEGKINNHKKYKRSSIYKRRHPNE